MKNLILRSLAAVCCVWAMTAHAKIILVPPPDVPVNLNAREFKELTARRNDLLTQFGATQEKIDSQAQDCHDVAEDSPKVSECIAKAKEVGVAVKDYRAALERFKAGLATSVDLQQSRSGMDDKLAMSAKHHARPIAIEAHGEIHVVMADGKMLSGQEAARLTEDDEARLVTGPHGGAVLTLVDGTHIKLGSNTEYLTKVAEPNPGLGEQPAAKPKPNPDMDKPTVAELVKGTLRWVHEESSEVMRTLNESSGQHARRIRHKLRMETIVLAERGTEFECAVLPDGSGYIKLYSGAVDLTPYDGGKILQLHPGQMVTLRGGKIGKPGPIR